MLDCSCKYVCYRFKSYLTECIVHLIWILFSFLTPHRLIIWQLLASLIINPSRFTIHEAQSSSLPVCQCSIQPPHHPWHPSSNVINPKKRVNFPYPELTASLTCLYLLPVVNASGCGLMITACLPLFTSLLAAQKHKDTVSSSIR